MKNKELSEKLKNWRGAANLSQKQVAQAMNYSTNQFVSNWERGVSYPPITSLRVLSRLYKVDANEIFDIVLKAALEKTESDLRKQFAKAK